MGGLPLLVVNGTAQDVTRDFTSLLTCDDADTGAWQFHHKHSGRRGLHVPRLPEVTPPAEGLAGRGTPNVAGFKTKRTTSAQDAAPSATTTSVPRDTRTRLDAAIRRWWFDLGFGGREGEGGGSDGRAEDADATRREPSSPRPATEGFMSRDDYIRLCVRVAQALSGGTQSAGGEGGVDAVAVAATAAQEWASDVGEDDDRAHYPTFYASMVGLAQMWCAASPADMARFVDNLNNALQPLETLPATVFTLPVAGKQSSPSGGTVDDTTPKSPSRPGSGRVSVDPQTETIPEEGPGHAPVPAPASSLAAHRPAPLVVGSPLVSPTVTPGTAREEVEIEQGAWDRGRRSQKGGRLLQSPRRPKTRTVAGGRMFLSGTGPRLRYPSMSSEMDDLAVSETGGMGSRLHLTTSVRWLHPDPHRVPGSILPSRPSALMGETARSRMNSTGGMRTRTKEICFGSGGGDATAAAIVAHASPRVASAVRAGTSFVAVHEMRSAISAAAFGPPTQPPGRWELVDTYTAGWESATDSHGHMKGGGEKDDKEARGGGKQEESLADWVCRMKETSRPPRGGPVALSAGIQTDILRRAIEGSGRPRTQSTPQGREKLAENTAATRGRPFTSGASARVWNRVGGSGSRSSFPASTGMANALQRPSTVGPVGQSTRTSGRLPEKVRPLPPAPAKRVVRWRPETRGLVCGSIDGAVPGQPLATDAELRRWGLV